MKETGMCPKVKDAVGTGRGTIAGDGGAEGGAEEGAELSGVKEKARCILGAFVLTGSCHFFPSKSCACCGAMFCTLSSRAIGTSDKGETTLATTAAGASARIVRNLAQPMADASAVFLPVAVTVGVLKPI